MSVGSSSLGAAPRLHAASAVNILSKRMAHIPAGSELRQRVSSSQLAAADKNAGIRRQPERRKTADTPRALREAQRKGFRALGICNNVASTIARETDGGVYMHAGPEIGVAATKSLRSQVTITCAARLDAWPDPKFSYDGRARDARCLQALPEQGSKRSWS